MFNVCTCFLETHIEQIRVQTDMGALVLLFTLYSTQHLQPLHVVILSPLSNTSTECTRYIANTLILLTLSLRIKISRKRDFS